MNQPRAADERTTDDRATEDADADAGGQHGLSRRSVMKAAGAAGATALVGFGATGTVAAEIPTIDDALDTAGGLQEALVVFDSNDDVDRLADLTFEHDRTRDYHAFSVLPIGYTMLTGSQIETVAGWSSVRHVQPNAELEFHNDDARERTGAKEVQQEQFYTGESTHAVVIDSGIDGDHPDHGTLRHNYKYTNPLDRETMWVDVGPADTDDNGHGTHTSGSVAGDGSASNGEYKGMAPDADLTVYSTGLTLAVVNSIGAFDHLIDQQRAGKTDVQLVSNSYGPTSGNGQDFNPDSAMNVATYTAFEAGILSLFSAGNSGPGTNTLSKYAKAPWVVGVAATDDEVKVTGFSSRGRKPSYDGVTNYDRQEALANARDHYENDGGSRPFGIYRNGVGANGASVVSTMAPNDPLQGTDNGDNESLARPYYAAISGTSMSCPVTAGVTALINDAYKQNHGEFPDPIDVLNTLEATARDARTDHNPYNIGAGFIDAAAAVERAEAGDLAGFDEVAIATEGTAPEFVFTPNGTRADDGSVFTAGQTNQVDITVTETATDVVVRDTIPFGWEIVAGDSATTYTEDGERFVEFDAPASAGETRTYFAEAPGSTGNDEFGPGQVQAADGSTVFVDVTDTETNTVGGVDTS
ncbi:S8 family serine peptidase [Halococcus agarilyticus]|uniref:S8 family serine peptidase n=1 Tax=Halococcus agarilyticus TaxID=1232219 RepID=UPI000B08C200|nr:S8 family serine peptidase [Halococcus agarilyticus]